MNHLNNFLANYLHLMSPSNLSNLMISNPLDDALASLRSLLPQPEPNIQLLQNLWQIINSTNRIPNAIQEYSLLQSSYRTNAAYTQDPFTFPNRHAGPQRPGEDFAINNSSAFQLKGQLRPDSFHDDTIRNSSEKETMLLPSLVSATDPESFGVDQMNQTSFPTETPAASNMVGTWDELLDIEDDSNEFFWKDLIKDL